MDRLRAQLLIESVGGRDDHRSYSRPCEAFQPGSVSEAIRQFTPNWFTATMGTGIVALAINQFPLPIRGLHEIGQTLWLTNILLFTLFSVAYATRWIFFFNSGAAPHLRPPR